MIDKANVGQQREELAIQSATPLYPWPSSAWDVIFGPIPQFHALSIKELTDAIAH
jgi:hypothetical protein